MQESEVEYGPKWICQKRPLVSVPVNDTPIEGRVYVVDLGPYKCGRDIYSQKLKLELVGAG